MKNDPQKLVSLPDLAKLLNLPAQWLKTEADAGRLPHLKIRNKYRFSVDAVVDVLVERAATGDAAVSGERNKHAKRTSTGQ